ncbi:MAG: trimeric intracellular cation channel family protein [Kiritimatiellaeota bacterium]|nr:trimeric intracellular cation channel family protein [Kiritimatiellota bacterium]
MNHLPPPQLILEHLGLFVAAITGVLAARGKGVDLFGVLVLALATAFGGGTMRDLLVGDLPVVWLRSPWYLINAISAALMIFVVCRFRALPGRALLIADAFTLAFFTMLGAEKGVLRELSAPVAVLLGVVTGVAGGIVRDVLLGTVPMVFRPEIRLYATAALCGAIVFVALPLLGVTGVAAVAIGAIVVLLLRLAGIYWKISLPIFEARE